MVIQYDLVIACTIACNLERAFMTDTSVSWALLQACREELVMGLDLSYRLGVIHFFQQIAELFLVTMQTDLSTWILL